MTPTYLIVGSGFVARHFKNYLSSLDLKHLSWTRADGILQLQKQATEATHILLAISDSSLSAFIDENLSETSARIIHFSGALEIPGAYSAHPLMTFADKLYPHDVYVKIPIILTQGTMEDLLPGLPNPSFRISAEQKPLYHALCVIGGNFTFLLWEKMIKGFAEMGLPSEVAFPYLQRILQNFEDAPTAKLTGPLARNDSKTIDKNLRALEGDPFQAIYRDFMVTRGIRDEHP